MAFKSKPTIQQSEFELSKESYRLLAEKQEAAAAVLIDEKKKKADSFRSLSSSDITKIFDSFISDVKNILTTDEINDPTRLFDINLARYNTSLSLNPVPGLLKTIQNLEIIKYTWLQLDINKLNDSDAIILGDILKVKIPEFIFSFKVSCIKTNTATAISECIYLLSSLYETVAKLVKNQYPMVDGLEFKPKDQIDFTIFYAESDLVVNKAKLVESIWYETLEKTLIMKIKSF